MAMAAPARPRQTLQGDGHSWRQQDERRAHGHRAWMQQTPCNLRPILPPFTWPRARIQGESNESKYVRTMDGSMAKRIVYVANDNESHPSCQVANQFTKDSRWLPMAPCEQLWEPIPPSDKVIYAYGRSTNVDWSCRLRASEATWLPCLATWVAHW
jgi:hypothetical protein